MQGGPSTAIILDDPHQWRRVNLRLLISATIAFNRLVAPPALLRHLCAVLLAAAGSQLAVAPHRVHLRQYHDYIRTLSPTGGSGRISLKPSRTGVYGLATSRGTRAYQEDTTSVSCVSLPPAVLRASYLASSSATLRDVASKWSPSTPAEQEVAGQLAWFACFDGHGGQPVSQFLCKELHAIFEDVQEDMVTDTVQYTRSLGGYFRRFNGGLLERWVRKEELKPVRAGAGHPRATMARAAAATRPTGDAKGPAVDAAERTKAEEAERQRAKEREREREAERSKPKTFADLVNSAKAGPAPSATQGTVGSGSGTVSAVEASAAGQTAGSRSKEEADNAPPQLSQQPALIHSAESRGEVPLAGPIEGAQGARSSQDSSASPSSLDSQPNSHPASSPPSAASEARAGLTSLTQRIPPPETLAESTLTLSERLTLAWLHTDRLIHSDPQLDVGGSTASVVLLHSLDTPTQPFYSSSSLFLTTAHIGDTRMLLASVSDGTAIPLTNYHHPDDRSESERLRKMGAGMITDSFGEARWMGALANTRSFGDSKFKKVGVTSEPEIISQLVRGDDYAFVVAFSDGIGGVMSDQEVVDLCRDARHPHDAAHRVLRFAEELGAQDNGTVLVVPLRGWGRMGGQDSTKQRREFRRSKVDLYRDSRT
ncbi:uncharacterized protein PFL1_04396 [Pseudozyma flocculosa PF-1]|uniref:PPM-type phosphatase domain-containing protein n=1 Tax=Pseudozyma flocculosa PF-1 TaxID=1277687 RepID=A0A061H6J0_9BASI|nr:uncharacterized protein PFL1_04396 [Pseudozyma flocculosa PF-1]EPQ28069.1 hypothetical protein PFL1_04396 [Pseudozyma flocculosa PF-1]